MGFYGAPATCEGRMLGVMLALAGMGLFAVFVRLCLRGERTPSCVERLSLM